MADLLEKKRLIKSLECGRGLQSIIDSLYEILGNPLIINDTSYRLMAYSENTVTDDILWNELISLGTFSHETVNFFMEEMFIDEVADAEPVALLSSPKIKYDRINSKIFDKDGIHIANICVVSCYRPFDENDYKLIEMACEVCSKEIEQSKFYKKSERVFQETFITRLIDGQSVNGEFEHNELNSLHKELKPNLFVAVVDITAYDYTLIHLGYFRDVFRELQSEYKYYIYLNNLVIIINLDSPKFSVKNDLKKLNEFFSENKIYAGISGKFTDLYDLQKYYKQAICALNYGMQTYKDRYVFIYDDFCIDHVINMIKDKIEAEDICNPIIWAMIEHDRQNGTRYIDTVYSFLLNGQNIELTAKQLGIGTVELKDRLKKLDEDFDIDWDNGNRVHCILFSIKFLAVVRD